MASGTINLNNSSTTSGGGYLIGKVVWSSTTNTTANTSTVKASLYIKKGVTSGTGTTATTGAWDCAVNVGGIAASQSVYATVGFDWVLMLEKTATISHNTDGTKSITISGTAYAPSGTAYSGKYTTGSASVSLDTIPRKSTLSASNGTLGTAQTLTISRASSSFTHSIRYDCGSASGAIVTKTSSTSVSWTPPIGLAAQNTTGTSVSVKLTLYTFSGDTEIGTTTKTITCAIPASVKPSCTVSASDPTGYADTYGGYVQGQSKIAITVTPTTAYSSPIASYNVTADGKTYTAASVTTPVISGSGTLTINATVKDKRARTGTSTTDITVLPYTAPTIPRMTVRRCDSDGTENNMGAYAKVTYTFAITSLSNQNAKVIALKYKKSSDTTYTSVALTSAYSATDATYIFAADDGSSYDIVLSVTDAFLTTERKTSVSTADVIMHFRADGSSIAFGKVSEKADAAEFGKNAYFTKNVYDKHDQLITNGLAEYADAASGYIDPDTTLSHLVLTAHANAPMGEGVFYYIYTVWYNGKSTSAYRAQFGIPYKTDGGMYHRYFNGSWSAWERHANYVETHDRSVSACSIKAYPTAAGIYRTIGTEIFSNLSHTHSNYGILVISRAYYAMHIYVDSSGRMFYGYSGDTFAEPSKWEAVDGIVEQGTSGIWTYRKYESGRAECWGSQSYTGSTSTTWGSMYGLACEAPNYPFTFASKPVVVRDISQNTSGSCWLSSWTAASTTNCGKFILLRPTTATLDATVNFYATGKWK